MQALPNTDAELARVIKSRIRKELEQWPLGNKEALKIVQEYMIELTTEIINEGV